MVEDEDGKIRRNLMAICTAILVLAWLDVPLASVAGRLLGEKPDTGQYVLSSVKVWSATAALLFYFALRYRFSDEAGQAAAHLRVSQSERYAKHFWRHLASIEASFNDGSMPAGEFLESVNAVIDRLTMVQGRPQDLKAVRPNVGFSLSRESPSPGLNHNLTLYVKWVVAPEIGPITTTGTVPYSMPEKVNKTLNRAAWVYAAVYSKGSMALLWPLGLLAMATVVVCWKLARAIFSP